MPDTPEFRAPFGLSARTRPGGGFPGARLMALFHAGTGRLLEAFAVPRAGHDRAWASRLHPRREAGDVLVGDRGFCSFAHLALLVPKGRHGLFRMHQRPIVDFTPGRPHVDRRRKDTAAGRPRSRGVRALGGTDPVVEGFRPNEAPSGLCAKQDAALPGSLLVRARRYRTEVPEFRTRVVTRATTRLEGAVYPAADLATLSFRRWAVERHLRELKQTRGRDVRRCQSVAGVTKELTVDCLASNLVKATMREAARRQDVSGDRVSFVDARRWLACTQAGEPLPELVVNPHRPGRFEPRSTKRRPKTYPWLTVPRHELRKRLLRQADAA